MSGLSTEDSVLVKALFAIAHDAENYQHEKDEVVVDEIMLAIGQCARRAIVSVNGNAVAEAESVRLFAAAPELLSALQAVVAVYERVGGPLAVDPAVNNARKAIAKATGK